MRANSGASNTGNLQPSTTSRNKIAKNAGDPIVSAGTDNKSHSGLQPNSNFESDNKLGENQRASRRNTNELKERGLS